MSDQNVQKAQNRREFLLALYKATDARESAIVSMWEVSAAIELSRLETDRVTDFLIGEGMIKEQTLGGGISITHKGILQAEEYMSNTETVPASQQPPSVVIIGHSANTQIQQVASRSSQSQAIPESQPRRKRARTFIAPLMTLLGTIAVGVLTCLGQRYAVDRPISATRTAEAAGTQSASSQPAILTWQPSEFPSPVLSSPGEDWMHGCISSIFWSAYSTTPALLQPKACLDLTPWGMEVQRGSLVLFVENPPTEVRRGIYTTPVINNVVTVSVRLDGLRTRFDNQLANLAIGIVPSNPVTPTSGVLLIYQVEYDGADVSLKSSERGTDQAYLQDSYQLRRKDAITIDVTSISSTIYLNGQLIIGPAPLPRNPVFWIGYLVPAQGMISAEVSDLSFSGK